MKSVERIMMILLTGVVALGLSLGFISKTSEATFIDPEPSNNNSLTIAANWSITLLNDGFEGSPWDANWDGNGTTDWGQLNTQAHGGSWAAECYTGDTYLTTDNLDASGASNITVSFWFYIKDLNKGPLYIQIYNGTSYNNWYDLFTYPGVVKNTWIQFSETITDSQYFRSDFRLRFDGSGSSTYTYVDDVLVTKN